MAEAEAEAVMEVEVEVEAQGSGPSVVDGAGPDTESRIRSAMRSRLSHFKDQADSLTLESVRRLLEKDLGLETYILDVHKKFIKECLSEILDHGGDTSGPKTSLKTVEKNVPTRKEEMEHSGEKVQTKKGVKEASSEDIEKMDHSQVMDLLSGQSKAKALAKDNKDIGQKGAPTESIIVKEAVKKRASYLKMNANAITMAGVRQLLEKDLKLDKNALLPLKKFISDQVDLVLNPPKVSKPTSSAEKDSKKGARGKPSKNSSSEESADSLDSESEEEDTKTRKKVAARRKVSDEPKKRKVPATGTKASNKKRLKVAEESSDAEAGGASEDDHSEASDEKHVKKKEVAVPSYGKRVEHLKSVIKSCGMSIPPVVYKKAKQVSDEKREAFLRKELEEILSREGLSADPSEKEIKDVKKRKERAKELEGLDMSNIVSSTRRRSTTCFVPPPKPKVNVENKDDDTKSSDDEGDSEDDSDSQSEELNEDADEDNSD